MNMPTMEIKLGEKMSVDELLRFMNTHGFSDQEFAKFMGITLQAVRLWKQGEREISLTNTRLLRMLARKPALMKEFLNGQ